MRKSLIVLIATFAACAPRGAGNETGNAVEVNAGQPEATLSVAAAQGGVCAMRWDGTAVTSEQARARGTAVLEAAIARLGGIENITEDNLPYVRLEAPSGAALPCVAPALGALQRAGFPKIALRPAGGRPVSDAIAMLLFDEEGREVRPSTIVALGAGGGMTLNGQPVDLAGLSARAPAGAPSGETFDERGPPGDFVIAMSAEATFGAAYEALRTAGHSGGEVWLTGCVRGGRPEVNVETLRC
jgi:hypothetical protein